MDPPGPCGLIALTKSAIAEGNGESTDGNEAAAAALATPEAGSKKRKKAAKKSKRKRAKKPDSHYYSARFSHYRSVVERVIGWLKQTSRFLGDAVYLSQSALVHRVLIITATLCNLALSKKPKMFANM